MLGGLTGSAGVILQTLPQDPWNPRAEKGPSTYDVTHVFTLSWIQLLRLERVGFLRPLGRPLTAGWQFLNITTLMSGSPFTVFSGKQQTGAGAGGTDRPDLLQMPHFSTRGKIEPNTSGSATIVLLGSSEQPSILRRREFQTCRDHESSPYSLQTFPDPAIHAAF